MRPALPQTMPVSRVLRAYAMEAKYETLRMLRTPAFAIPFLALPVLLYLLFAAVMFGEALQKDARSQVFLFLGFSTFGVMGPGMFGFGRTVALERDQGLLRLKRALPVPTGSHLIAKMLMAMLFVAIMMGLMCAIAPLGHLRASAGQLSRLSAIYVAGTLPFCALGFLIGTLVSGKAAPAIVNLFYLPMVYLSGILIPLPKSMRQVATFSPAYHLHQLGLAAMGAPSQGSIFSHIAVLTAVTLLFAVIAIRRLQRAG